MFQERETFDDINVLVFAYIYIFPVFHILCKTRVREDVHRQFNSRTHCDSMGYVLHLAFVVRVCRCKTGWILVPVIYSFVHGLIILK